MVNPRCFGQMLRAGRKAQARQVGAGSQAVMRHIFRAAILGQDRPAVAGPQLVADGGQSPAVHLADFGMGGKNPARYKRVTGPVNLRRAGIPAV